MVQRVMERQHAAMDKRVEDGTPRMADLMAGPNAPLTKAD